MCKGFSLVFEDLHQKMLLSGLHFGAYTVFNIFVVFGGLFSGSLLLFCHVYFPMNIDNWSSQQPWIKIASVTFKTRTKLHFPKFNKNKSGVIWLWKSEYLTLWLILHSALLSGIWVCCSQLDNQFSVVVNQAFSQKRVTAKVKSYLQFEELEKVIHTFISSWLHHCNALHVALEQPSLWCLKIVNTASHGIPSQGPYPIPNWI